MKLTKAQIEALRDFLDVFKDRDSGYASPSELGIHTNIVVALHKKGMLDRDRPWCGADVDFKINEAGRAALAKLENWK